MDGSEARAADAAALELFVQCQQSRAVRDREGLFCLEGARSFLQALDGGHRIHSLVISQPLMIPEVARQARLLRRQGVASARLEPGDFRALARLERASGIAALLPQPWQKLHRMPVRPGQVWIALEQVRSLGNLGSLVRTAEALGAAGFILLGPVVDPFDPQVVRASMGALFHQRFTRCHRETFAQWVRRHKALVIGASPEAEPLSGSLGRTRRPIVLLLGSEREGLSEAQRALCEQSVSIPMRGRVDSLNLAVAGSLLLYELLGRRNLPLAGP